VRYDAAVVGGGPAGLAVGIELALAGRNAVVFERRRGPVDKACGEGLMPKGRAALERMGVRALLDPDDVAAFESITYFQDDGRSVTGRLPPGGGLTVRRIALSAALAARARALGVTLHDGCRVHTHQVTPEGVRLTTDAGDIDATLLVAADGLHSAVRKAAGLDRPTVGRRRFGLRRHIHMAPWAASVEVHFGTGVEAYVTPAGPQRVGVAFLWAESPSAPCKPPIGFETLLAQFPALQARLADHPFDSAPRGAGPMLQRVTGRIAPRLVLVGDAAGFVDAISGEGVSLAFEGAAELARQWPTIEAGRGSVASLRPYDRAMQRLFTPYARLARALVFVAARPTLRRLVIDRLIARPALFEWALAR
jgi:2-polyprenyl-6-methoxyphenol hydroxylase-like FAD-dependent oxidoreductase